MSVAQLAEALGVTPTAVRQRVSRLMGDGWLTRQEVKALRGRPSHRYSLTEKARQQIGSNFADLALTLWDEIRSVKDLEIRRGLLERIARRMAGRYRQAISGATTGERMESLAEVFAERQVPFSVEQQAGLPVLTAHDCPYPELAERDRTICAVERMLFSDLLEENVHLAQCRLDGDACCQFQPN